MPVYFVDIKKQEQGNLEVHKLGCFRMPELDGMKYLGEHTSWDKAVAEARKLYPHAGGCYYCSDETLKVKPNEK